MTTATVTTDDHLREAAIKRLKEKREFRTHLFIYLVVNAMLIGIWATTSGGYFWPIFPLLGWGVGIAGHAWEAYGRSEPSEMEIRHEMNVLSRH
jgi:hypothetical protein